MQKTNEQGRAAADFATFLGVSIVHVKVLEAPPGIEPGCTDLQSAASPLRHRAVPEARSLASLSSGFNRRFHYMGVYCALRDARLVINGDNKDCPRPKRERRDEL